MTTNNTTPNPLADGRTDEAEQQQNSTADKENQNRATSRGKEEKNKKNSKSTNDYTSNSTNAGFMSSTTAATNTVTAIATSNVTATSANRSSRSDFTSQLNGVNPKTDGWAMELEDSEKHYKRTSVEDEGSNEVLFRLLQAQFKMRKFDDLMKVATSDEKGQKIVETSFTPQQSQVLKIYKVKGEQILNIPSDLTQNVDLQRLLKDARRGKKNINSVMYPADDIPADDIIYNNIFHYACIMGDIRLMEAVVAHGAAIDKPLDLRPIESPSTMVRTNVTALTFACAVMAFEQQQEQQVISTKQERIECVVQLIKVGADCSSQLCLPPPRHTQSLIIKAFREAGFDGKTAYELGIMTKEKEIIGAMNRMKTTDDKIKNAHCRCGSRLPWLECHAGSREEIHDHYHIGGTNSGSDNERVIFRLSPAANCPCNKNTGTTKTYFMCCWKETVNPTYLDDKTFDHIIPKLCLNDTSAQKSVLENYSYRVKERLSGLPLRNLSPSDFVEELKRCFPDDPDTAKKLRQEIIVCRSGRRSVIYDSWDMEIYYGIMKRIPNSFEWIDLHWDIPSRELRARADEWNSALEKYCDDVGVTGRRRRTTPYRGYSHS